MAREVINESELLEFIKKRIKKGHSRIIYLKESNEKLEIKRFWIS